MPAEGGTPRPRLTAFALAFLLAVPLLACGGDEDGASGTSEPAPATTESTGAEEPSASTAPPTTLAPADLSVALRLEEVARLESPLAMVPRPGHPGLFVIERAGRLRHLDTSWEAGTALVDLTQETTTDGERGLLGLAFSPDGEHLYLSYTDRNGHSRLDEWTLGEGTTDIAAGSRRNLLSVEQPFANHNGGHIVFGPDGHLWYGLGDGGSGGDPSGTGQDPSDLLGSILRIDPGGGSGGQPYGVPRDNGFAGAEGGGRGRPEVHVFGLRNPWRFTFDRAKGDLWIGDVGQSRWEEVTLLRPDRIAGANLGWDALEGSHQFEGEPPAGAVPPIVEYPHEGDVCSVTGGYVYRGREIPGLVGAYLYGDLCVARLRGLAIREGGAVDDRDLEVPVPGGRLVSFAEDAGGELYVLSQDGGIFRITPA